MSSTNENAKTFKMDASYLAVPTARVASYCFTHFNYTDEIIEALKKCGADYGVIGKEICPTTNREHLQGYVFWKNKKMGSALIKEFPVAQWRVCKGSAAQNFVYCTKKDPEYITWGSQPMDQKQKGKAGGDSSKEKWKQVLKWARAGDFDSIEDEYPELVMFNEGLLVKHFQKANSNAVPDVIDGDMPGVWIMGPKGSGKSDMARKMAREEYGCAKAFSKPCNNYWWTDYNFQDTVILDDLDPTCSALSYEFKTWIDRYKCQVRIHHGMLSINPKNFIVTSQYDIATVFKSCGEEVIEAMERRFPKVIVTDEDDGEQVRKRFRRQETPLEVFGDDN